MNLIITRVLKYGGTNDYLTTLIKYLGAKNVILILFDKNDVNTLKIQPKFKFIKYHYIPLPLRIEFNWEIGLRNLVNLYKYLVAFCKILFYCKIYSSDKIFISAITQRSFLYFFTFPFIQLFYVLHSEPRGLIPNKKYINLQWYLNSKKQIITVSESNKSLIFERWNVSDRSLYVNVVYNPIKAEHNFGLAKYKKSKIVLTLGHLESYKNPFFWIKVAQAITCNFRDVYFLWVGDGSLYNECSQLVHENKQIKFLGYRNNVSKYLKMSSVYFQPSLSETQGIAVLDALNCGIPCVVSNIGGLVETIYHNYNGFVFDVNDLEKCIDQISKLLTNSEIVIEFQNNSRKIINEKFTYQIFEDKMNDLVFGLKN